MRRGEGDTAICRFVYQSRMTWRADNTLMRPENTLGSNRSWMSCKGCQARAEGDKATREVTTPTTPSRKTGTVPGVSHHPGITRQAHGDETGWRPSWGGNSAGWGEDEQGARLGIDIPAAWLENPSQPSHCSFTWIVFSAVWSHVAAGLVDACRAWTTCMTWCLSSFFLEWKRQRRIDYDHHLF